MKIQIDTEKKTLKLEENIKLVEFLELLNKIFPDSGWKEYTLETNTIINNWNNPIIINRGSTYPTYPWYYSPYFIGDTSSSLVYNLSYNA